MKWFGQELLELAENEIFSEADYTAALERGPRLAGIVKQFFKHASESQIDRKEWPEPRLNPDYNYKLLTRRPIIASPEEIHTNKRSRSAKLRVVEKI